MAEKILIEIAADGATTVKAQGFKGRSCIEATEQIERALGQVVADRKTPEFHLGQNETGRQQVTQ